MPRTIYIIDHARLSPSEQAFAVTLQGLANTREARVWMRTGPGSLSAIVEKELRSEGVDFVETPTIWELWRRLRGEVKGGILYRAGTESLSVATALCGLLQAVAVEESLREKATEAGLTILRDVRMDDDRKTLAQYRDRFTRGILIEQALDKSGHLRDFAVARRAFTFSAGKDSAFRTEVVRTLGPNALVYGWGPDEYQWVNDLSRANASGVAADWSQNLSALQHIPASKLRRPRRPLPEDEANVHYVSFVLSDGDNIQWLGGGFPGDTKFWASPLRGTFPMTWEIAPILSEVAPRALSHLYATAKPTDGFVTGAGLPGYTFPHLQTDRTALAKQTAPVMRKADVTIGSVLNANEGDLRDTIPLLEIPEMDGILYKDYSPYNRRKGEILWHRGKPCISYRCLLWNGLMEPEDVAREIRTLPASPRTDPQSYTFVNVHAWSYGAIGGPLEAVRRAIALLPAHARVVTADQAISLMRHHFKNQS